MLAGWLVGWLGTGWVVVHVLELSGAGKAGKAVGHLGAECPGRLATGTSGHQVEVRR